MSVNFPKDQLRSDVLFPDGTSRPGLLAFSRRPFDSRTAALVALVGPQFTEADISSARPLGAPIVFACLPGCYQVWTQGAERPRFFCPLTPSEVPGFFRQHAAALAPDAICRAKTWARLEKTYQLDFVDTGLLPVVEEAAGEKLRNVIERVVTSARKRLGWAEVSDADGRWLLQAIFWLLAAKILQDKEVPGFVRLALTDLESVYGRLSKHYNSENPRPVTVGGRERRAALEAAAIDIQNLGHCGLVSTEALAHLYESALIDRATRQRLGTHSTPPWLVDYIVGRLRPWINDNEMPPRERHVFEPACGHAAFLISAMRLLSELLPPDWREPLQSYLRHRLHGMERDTFALEIARLSLTLADVPNPNGWDLTEANMFTGDLLERSVREASIVLGNPPFEPFEAGTGKQDWLHSKAAETFRRVVENLRPGSVFGFVLPQTLLHSQEARALRQVLLRDYEISEISLFADKVFRYGEPESTVIIGRRFAQDAPRHFAVRYQRIREGQVADFSRTYAASSEMTVQRERLLVAKDASLVIPELDDLWRSLAGMRHLEEFAVVGQGFSHRSPGSPMFSADSFKNITAFATKLRHSSDGVSTFLNGRLSGRTRQALATYEAGGANLAPLQTFLVEDINTLIKGLSLYDAQRFAGVTMRPETKQLLERNPQEENLARLNRLLLEDAYPLEISTREVQSRQRFDDFVAGFAGWREDQMTHLLPPLVWLNLDPKVILAARHGKQCGRQVVLNYAPVSRQAWRVKALIDEKGHPVTSRFIVVRPEQERVSLLALWGLLNSPLANAYVFCRSSKRDVLAGDMRKMPVPDLGVCDLAPLEKAVSEYLAAARAVGAKPHPTKRSAQQDKSTDQMELFRGKVEAVATAPEADRLKFLHWRVDAEVVRLYNLPAKLERRLLDLFGGVRRRGVPFLQTDYFPKGYTGLERLSDLVAITADWDKTNRQRGKLMDLEDEGRLTPVQAEELANLQRLADALLGLMEPWKPDEVDRAVEQAKQRGVWKH
ncbi:MAG TPA: N-6 DNA methylase [Dongiaceae bacterium]|nr:N-6 DNA methylase [Dongiaceae bacterium]